MKSDVQMMSTIHSTPLMAECLQIWNAFPRQSEVAKKVSVLIWKVQSTSVTKHSALTLHLLFGALASVDKANNAVIVELSESYSSK